MKAQLRINFLNYWNNNKKLFSSYFRGLVEWFSLSSFHRYPLHKIRLTLFNFQLSASLYLWRKKK